jgi:hypothetical protein
VLKCVVPSRSRLLRYKYRSDFISNPNARCDSRILLDMMIGQLSLLVATGLLSRCAYAQFPPALEGVTVLDSHIEDGIRISYKEVRRRAYS